MYNPTALKSFLDQWKPQTLPIRLTQVIYEFTEFIGQRVRVDTQYLSGVLKLYGFHVEKGVVTGTSEIS
jgi:hypothetical protein